MIRSLSSRDFRQNYQVGNSHRLVTSLSRVKEHCNLATELNFDPPFNFNSNCQDAVFELNQFELNSDHKINCQMFCIIENWNRMKIKVRVSSKMILNISSVVLHSDMGTTYKFSNFRIISEDPYECLSSEIFDTIGYPTSSGFYVFQGHIKFGCITYAIKDKNSIGDALLKNSLEMGEYHDLTVKLDDGKEFKVHKMVLAFRSQVFKKMIDSDMMENKTGVIRIREVETDVMHEILNFIYGLFCDLSKSPHGIFQVAHLYELNELTKMCKAYMMLNVNYKNFFAIFKLVDIEDYELQEVGDALGRFLKSEESNIVENVEFIADLAANMRAQSIHYLFELCMKFDLSVKERVIRFIAHNLNDTLQNPAFEKLLIDNPRWSIQIFSALNATGLLAN